MVELPRYLRQKLIDEILNRLRGLGAAANTTEQRGGRTHLFFMYSSIKYVLASYADFSCCSRTSFPFPVL